MTRILVTSAVGLQQSDPKEKAVSEDLPIGVFLRVWTQHCRDSGLQSSVRIHGVPVVVVSGHYSADYHYCQELEEVP